MLFLIKLPRGRQAHLVALVTHAAAFVPHFLTSRTKADLEEADIDGCQSGVPPPVQAVVTTTVIKFFVTSTA
jgi:hypothetical protein